MDSPEHQRAIDRYIVLSSNHLVLFAQQREEILIPFWRCGRMSIVFSAVCLSPTTHIPGLKYLATAGWMLTKSLTSIHLDVVHMMDLNRWKMNLLPFVRFVATLQPRMVATIPYLYYCKPETRTHFIRQHVWLTSSSLHYYVFLPACLSADIRLEYKFSEFIFLLLAFLQDTFLGLTPATSLGKHF